MHAPQAHAAPRKKRAGTMVALVLFALLLVASVVFYRSPKVVWLRGSNKLVAVRGHHGHQQNDDGGAAPLDEHPAGEGGKGKKAAAKKGGGGAKKGKKAAAVHKAAGHKADAAPALADAQAAALAADNGASYATLHTTEGDMVWLLHPAAAPLSVANFKALVADGFHNRSCVYRYEKGFVLQGGGCGGKSSPKTVPLEYKLPNERHSVALARSSSPHSGGSEFFVNLRNNTGSLGPGHNGGYAVFATMVGGFATLQKMKKLPAAKRGRLTFFKVPPKILYVTFSSVRPPVEAAAE
jgi:cyclophilin family peptidyl-prolyl cis-trans isomerase